ncbi:tetratricopeptide repeat protein [Uliginosibacterium aquaticum]|uniref:Tetratricopeptide repeat protein n=1 Tax=Uliginosibacterium aquaticum TaxID=2731212 RepID=A0ABX2IDN2_9RHOO|nr:tetratricopeptide repeat protein [Uliginosibacterium aquaticum]NSL54706.1 tetratricopeptide repeat protein [Uliginosibacterium aquaticum]
MKKLFLICLLASAQPFAALSAAVPDDGLKAEMAGNWEGAILIYRRALATEPGQSELWLRLADIHGHLKQYEQASAALEQACRLQPDEPTLWHKLSQSQSMAGNRDGALASINKAVELAPENLDYLRAKAELAKWAGDRPAAIDAYQRIAQRTGSDTETILGVARLDAWGGQLDKAVSGYKRYLEIEPAQKEVWLELIRTEGWRGNYPDALDELEDYRVHFDADRAYDELRARSLAWLGKSKPALEITDRLLSATPHDADILAIRAIALQAANRPREALETLRQIETLLPDTRDTADLALYLRTPQRSSVTAYADYGKDSDQVHTGRWGLVGEYVMSPETRFLAGGDWQKLKADSGSGLDNINGARDADYQGAWIGARHSFSPELSGDLRLGGAASGDADASQTYRAGLDIRASDDWWLRPEIGQDYYAVSPRALSLGIERRNARLLTRWTPGTRYTVESELAYDDLSDGNRRWEVSLAPRRAMWRTQSFNIDLGVAARWFGFSDDLDHGYYDPQHYQRYALTGMGYWKLNDNNAIGLSLSYGTYKDNTQDSFKLGGDAVIQGYFGIWSNWYLRMYASVMNNVRQASGAYQGGSFGMALTRRF